MSGLQFPQKTIVVISRLDILRSYAQKTEANGGPPPLGTHILMGESSIVKRKNVVENITTGHIAPVEIIAQKN